MPWRGPPSATLTTAPADAAALGIAPALAAPALRGTLLFCGPDDVGMVRLDRLFGPFLRGVLWSHGGRRDFAQDRDFARLSVLHEVTAAFPPAFIPVGNADPLAPHAVALAEALRRRGVAVETLFLPPDHSPALGHEYQFDLDGEAGRLALERVLAFLRARLSPAS